LGTNQKGRAKVQAAARLQCRLQASFHCQLVLWMHSLRCVEVQTTLFHPVSIVIPSIHPDTPLAMMAPAGWGLWGKAGG
jgi:hypothetical protein